MSSEVTTVDRIRAAQTIMAQLTGDAEMFAYAVAETVDDERDVSVVNLVRALSEDLAAALLNLHGDDAVVLLQRVIAGMVTEAEL